MNDLPKAYEPQKYEDDIYKKWEASGFFNPDICVAKGKTKKNAQPFSVVLPPPNVTGTLHIGHAMMLAIEDLVVRYKRMRGFRTLWLPGTDHAAIATQTKVEKLLMEKGMKDPKQELGREKFLAEVEKFAQASHDMIVNQCKKMGSSLDWSREAFTLDEKRNLAVRAVFKKMYDDGLIYRGFRIVNWCPRCHSTLADDEVEYKEQAAKIYTFKYSKDFPIAISTTRPETKLGDTAVAVNPKDKRYKKYIGQVFEIKNFTGSSVDGLPVKNQAGSPAVSPLARGRVRGGASGGPNLKIKIIGDPAVDMNFGAGAVGVTPAHSFADYEMYLRHNLRLIKIINEDGRMTSAAGEKYIGKTVKEARALVLESLSAQGLLEKEEEIPNNLSICYRCGTAIEPLPSKQWFVAVNKKFKKKGKETTLKELMRNAVESKGIKIIPDKFEKVYYHWIDNLRDWCISRQIWYGHRIPVYYCKQNCHSDRVKRAEESLVVSIEKPKNCPRCGGVVVQDPDTLDTWFSSGLWTFSTLGWPSQPVIARSQQGDEAIPSDLATYHPTSLMETGYDILFFWVARMILMSTYVLDEIPFEKVYLHGLVRDEQGRKMSKTLGNVIDPLDMTQKYGADATRLSLLLGNTPGNDTRLSEEKIAGFRNFTNKLWNICRFIINVIASPEGTKQSPIISPETASSLTSFAPRNDKMTLADKWILSRLNIIIIEVTNAIDNYQFSLAGEKLRDFTWSELADWYLEIAKIEGNKEEILNYIFNTILKLWHPFMPFVTEQIWQEVYGAEQILMIENWPKTVIARSDSDEAISNFETIKAIITGIRALRAENKIEPAKKLNAIISTGKKQKYIKENEDIIKGLARLNQLQINQSTNKPINSVGFFTDGLSVYIDLAGAVDTGKEKDRLQKEIAELRPYILGLEKKLSNNEFIQNAPAPVVKKEKQKLHEAKEKLEKLNLQLQDLQ